MPPARAFARPSSAQSLGFSASGVIHVVQNLRPADVTVSTSASQVVVPCPQACPVGSMCDLVLGDCVHDIATSFSVVNFRHFLYVDRPGGVPVCGCVGLSVWGWVCGAGCGCVWLCGYLARMVAAPALR